MAKSKSKNSKINLDAKMWIQLAIDDSKDAKILLKAKRYKTTLFSCHAMLEKAIKGLLAQCGKLNSDDRHHNLTELAKKLTLYKKFDKETKSFLTYASKLHQDATYPATDYLYEVLNDKVMVKYVYNKSCEVLKQLLEYYCNNEKANGNNHEKA